MITSWKDTAEFEKFLVLEYFRLGSIDKVYSAHHFNLPISFAGYHRVLTRFGVVKSAGPNSELSESLRILTELSTYKIPLERIYHHYAPKSIQVSSNTLHRMLHYIRIGLTRRQGTALIITEKGRSYSFLTGIERYSPNSHLGRKGDMAIPMGHSKVGEDPKDAIARVLQQEVFTDLVASSSFPWQLISKHPKPEFFINIADIKVAVYHLELPSNFQYSSYKLKHFDFRNISEVSSFSIRPGVHDILQNYLDIHESPEYSESQIFNSNLNLALAKIDNQ